MLKVLIDGCVKRRTSVQNLDEKPVCAGFKIKFKIQNSNQNEPALLRFDASILIRQPLEFY